MVFRDVLREAEIQDLDDAALHQEEIGGLDVAMENAGAVRRIKRIGDLDAEVDRLMDLDRPVRQQLAQGLPLEQLHHEVGSALVLADVVDRADILMVQRGSGACFGAKPLEGAGVRQFVWDELEGDGPSQANVFARVDDTHPTGTQLGGDAIVTNRASEHRVLGDGRVDTYANTDDVAAYGV
jgi:hypothetical protein